MWPLRNVRSLTDTYSLTPPARRAHAVFFGCPRSECAAERREYRARHATVLCEMRSPWCRQDAGTDDRQEHPDLTRNKGDDDLKRLTADEDDGRQDPPLAKGALEKTLVDEQTHQECHAGASVAT